MAIDHSEAEQIAALLNERNKLTVRYTGARVLTDADRYIVRHGEDGRIIGFVEVKKVQWYQVEIRHLTVADGYERKGHGKALLASAEAKARSEGARLLQCTIRSNNDDSQWLFVKVGYRKVSTFLNTNGGNIVDVFHKVISPPTE